ncbi:hypothetical protein ES708_28455 [subsurface metagenome]
MPSLQLYLKFASHHLDHARSQAQTALELAKTRGYDPDWIAALNRTLANNHETHRQLTNLITLNELTPSPIPSKKGS